jgi:mannose-6-phosphate isomerase-like protein (cupin superfamily)
LNPIDEWQAGDRETFEREVVASNEPVVIRSLVADWASVAKGSDPASLCSYLESMDKGVPVYTIAASPDSAGRFFYSDDLKGLNFKRGQIPLPQVLGQLLAQLGDKKAHSIAVQSLPVRDVIPGFEADNPMALLDAAPTMWIGSRGKVAPHYDVHRNVACVVAGRRHFTLYPPDQIANLYPGPILGAPGGVPISMVDIWDPDLDKYPGYAQAVEVAQEASLEPGDAIYIPALWWHAVESLEPLNVLVNYWWGGIPEDGVSPNDSLLHALLTIARLDDDQRQAWREFFDYYVFRTGRDPRAHIPDGLDDVVTSLSPEQADKVRKLLADKLR